jgi:hypothetical protein
MQKNCSTPDLAKLLLLFVVLLFAREGQSQKVQPQKTPVMPEAAPPLPGLVITLEKQAIREEEQVPVHLVLSNSFDKPLSDVTLSWNLPSALLHATARPINASPVIRRTSRSSRESRLRSKRRQQDWPLNAA